MRTGLSPRPNAGFAGVDTFTYKAYNGLAYSQPAVATIFVTNATPVSPNLSYSTHFNTPLIVPQPGLLGSVEGQDNNPLVAVQGRSPLHGSLALSADGSFTYTPATNYVGPDNSTFQVFDGSIPARSSLFPSSSATRLPRRRLALLHACQRSNQRGGPRPDQCRRPGSHP